MAFRLAIRDLWIAGWTLTDIADEMRRRTGSADARDLVVHAVLVEDARWADHAKSEAWNHEVGVPTTTSGLADATPGWFARWVANRANSDAALDLAFDVLDEIYDAQRRVL